MSNSTKTRKKKLIEALQKSLGVVTTACNNVGIDRSTYYEWLKDDPEFAKQVESLKDVAIDFVETNLYKQIQSGVPSSTIFYLKTKGKQRGYVEQVNNYNVNMEVDTNLDEEELDKELERIGKAIDKTKET